MGRFVPRSADATPAPFTVINLLTQIKCVLFLIALVANYLLSALGAAPPLAVLLPRTTLAAEEGYLAGLDATFFLSCYLSKQLDVEKLVYSLRSYAALRVRWRATYFLVHFGPSLVPPPRARSAA